jgi:serine/threonine protein kinase
MFENRPGVVPLEFIFRKDSSIYFIMKIMKNGDLFKQLEIEHSFD